MNNHSLNSRENRDRQLFNKVAEHYSLKEWSPEMAYVRRYQLGRAVMPLLISGGIGTIIEVACGSASSAKHLEGFYNKYIGIDYSLELINLARKMHKKRANVEFRAQNIKDVRADFEPKADLLLILGALHHFSEIDESLEAIKRISKSGAAFVALEPQSGNPLIQFLRWMRGVLDPTYSSEQIFFTEKELRELLEKHGYLDVEVEYQGFFSPPFGQMSFPPRPLNYILSAFAVSLDKIADSYLPKFLRFLSWNIIVRGRFP